METEVWKSDNELRVSHLGILKDGDILFRHEHGRGKDEKVPKFGVGYGQFEVYLVY